jgi:hypothetical protein
MSERDIVDFGDFAERVFCLMACRGKLVFLPVAVRIFLSGLELLSSFTCSYGITRVGQKGHL